MFWDNFVKICNKNGVKPNKVCSDLGFSSGTATWWRKGRKPRDTALQKIAEYFDITVEELLEEKKPTENGGRLEEFTRLFESLSPEQQDTFLSQIRWIADKK